MNIEKNTMSKRKHKACDVILEQQSVEPEKSPKLKKKYSVSLPDIKKKRLSPKEKIELEKKKYVMKPPCTETCRKNCQQKFTEEERYKIWSTFRDMDKQNQRNFISRNVRIAPTQTFTKANSKRIHTFTWYINNVIVCKPFFLNTLGFINAQTITSILNANMISKIRDVDLEDAAPDRRGRLKPWNSFPEGYKQKLMEFIEKTLQDNLDLDSKYASKNQYQSYCTSLKKLYYIYISHCEQNEIQTCSWTYFHYAVKNMNCVKKSVTDSVKD